jgi:hypothetical protein
MITRMFFALSILLLAVALVRFEPERAQAADEPLLVIVGTSMAASDIAFPMLKDVFRGRSVNLAGKKLIPINHPLGAALRVSFDRAVLGLEPAAVGRFWVDARIRDEGKPPTTASTPDLAIRIAASLANAISYGTPAMLNPKVKALTVDGKSATQPGYALKRK